MVTFLTIFNLLIANKSSLNHTHPIRKRASAIQALPIIIMQGAQSKQPLFRSDLTFIFNISNI